MVRTVSRNGQDLYIRPLRDTEDDADRLLAFFMGLGAESRRLFRPHAFTRDDALRATHDCQSAHSSRFVLASPQDAIVGYAYFSDSGAADPRIPMLGIALADAYQNQGLGHVLMQTLAEEARAQGKAGLQLTVYKDNARAIHVYASMGYRMLGEADGARQWAMRLDFGPSDAVYDGRGIFLDAVPWGLAGLTVDTWTATEWAGYLNFLHAAGANMVQASLWPGHYYRPDDAATLPQAWRYGVLRQALEHARSLGMQTYVSILPAGVPPGVWLRSPGLRASEVAVQGASLCWRRGRAEAERYAAFLADALAGCSDGLILRVGGPGLCACPACRDYAAVVAEMVGAYTSLLAGRCALHLDLSDAASLERRLGAGLLRRLAPALPGGRFALVAAGDSTTRALLQGHGIASVLALPQGCDGLPETEATMPRPGLRQVDRVVAQNSGVAGVMGRRVAPRLQFVSDFVLLQRLLFPARANHEVLRSLGSHLYDEPSEASAFARAVWALDAWWDGGSAGDLADACDGLSSLHSDRLGLVPGLRDAVQLLRELDGFLAQGERHFDALVARAHTLMARSPVFQGYTVGRVWQTRARAAVAACVTEWLEVLRGRRGRSASRAPATPWE